MKSSYDKEETRMYNAYYRDVVLKKKKNRSTQFIPQFQVICHQNFTTEPLTGSFKTCSTFGCNSKLTDRETLFGTKCINCHQKGTGFDITNIIFKK